MKPSSWHHVHEPFSERQISQLLFSSSSPSGSYLIIATNQILNELISSMNANISLCSHLIRRLF